MMRVLLTSIAVTATALGTGLAGSQAAGASPAAEVASAATARAAAPARATDYVVLQAPGATAAAAKAAVAAAGGRVVRENAKLGYLVARSADGRFAANLDASPAVVDAAPDRVIGTARTGAGRPRVDVERMQPEREASKRETAALRRAGVAPSAAAPSARSAPAAPAAAEPLAGRQWDMRQVGATPQGSYARQTGKRGVLVGVIDTGVDGTHPDIAPNFDRARSRNFVTDDPAIDGPCEHPSCVDPADEDPYGHGTHVASSIGSPINGLGIAGVAPGVRLVNIRASHDVGYFFLVPTLDALTYAGDIGVDVINMSFFVDPWLFNCVDNPADSPAEQREQRVIRELVQRAVNYARGRGVMPIAAMGNAATDLNAPTVDTSSPNFPSGAERTRTIDNSCITVPTETGGVTSVSATGPSTRKAYYSNYGTEQTDVAAPGGDVYDTPDNTRDARAGVLGAYPAALAAANGDLNPDGTPNNEFVVRDCRGTTCAYYQYLQGTSMAAPHASGVAALIVSQFGRSDRRHGGLTLAPDATRTRLLNSAVEHACPQPRVFHYTRILPTPPGGVAQADHRCDGGIQRNGFYGHGIVNAYAAVTARR